MKSVKRRLETIEAGAAGARPILIVKQDLDRRDVYHGAAGQQYSDAELEQLADAYQVIRIDYVDAWRNGDEKR